jgi:hypothetical protein
VHLGETHGAKGPSLKVAARGSQVQAASGILNRTVRRGESDLADNEPATTGET